MEQEFSKLQETMKNQLEQAQLEIRETMVREMSELLRSFMPQMKGKESVEGAMPERGDLSSAPKIYIDGDSSAPKDPLPQNHPNIVIQPQAIEDEVPDFDELEKMNRLKQEFSKQLEETRRDMEEKFQVKDDEEGSFGLSIKDLNLVPDVQIPHKFRVPEFEKYEGKTCPDNHLVMYCRKMAGFSSNEKLLIHCFQDSLMGSALRWYNQLTRAQIKSWKDLAKAFKEHYKHVTDMVPNRLLLQSMGQRQNENLREYARRWREMAVQVQPPLYEHEVAPMFVDTLRGVLYDKLICIPVSSFAEVVTTGERIETALRNGRLEVADTSRKNYRRREQDVNNTNSVEIRKEFTVSQPQSFGGREQNFQKKADKESKKVPTFPPLPVTYKELFDQLQSSERIRPYPASPRNPPFPAWFNPDVNCEYHSNVPGHTIEDCIAFKKLVQGLIRKGVIKVGEPNTSVNPLPN